MERLTWHNGEQWTQIQSTKVGSRAIYEKLAAYENTGLTPEEVQELVEYAPVKRGKWIYNTDEYTPHMRCSVCGYNKPVAAGENIEQEPLYYCSNCGAKMDLGGSHTDFR